MPFELGLSVAYEKSSKKRKHEWFVCESMNFRLAKSLSDLNGTDPYIHPSAESLRSFAICLFEAIASLPFSRCGSSIEKCQRVSLSSCDKLALGLYILLVFLRICVFLLVPLLTVSSTKGSNGWRSATFNKNPSAERGRLHTGGVSREYAITVSVRSDHLD